MPPLNRDVHRHLHRDDGAGGGWVHRLLSLLPHYRWETWAVLTVGSVYLFRSFTSIRRRFERKEASDPSAPGRR